MFNKGQAALEFLTTYGWAFLVILVMIGGLSYFGVFDFKAKIPDSCSFSGQQVDCLSYQLNNATNVAGNNQVQLRIKNLGDKDMTVVGLDIIERSLKADNKPACSLTTVTGVPDTTVEPRTEADIFFRGDIANCGFIGAEKGTFDVILKFTGTGSTIQSSLTGTITTTVVRI